MYNLTKKMRLTSLIGISMFASTLFAQTGYVAGDFHQHSTYTDGSWSIGYVMQKNAEFGLDWWANSEHGGGFTRNGDISGTDYGVTAFWDLMYINPIAGDVSMSDGHQVMWRWQSLKDFGFRNILEARREFPSKLIIQGYEMNVPGHEHGSVSIIGRQLDHRNPDVNALAEFEYKFDASDADISGGVSMGWTKSSLTGHARTLEAIEWLQANYKGQSWLIPAHPERKRLYTLADFRDMNNAGPDVCFGFESMPGHQKGPNRGGYTTSADGGGTYGGCGYYAAKVGGLWDALLSEGRNFWLFASSDFHDIDDDFFPGEYQKTYTFVKNLKRSGSIVNGLRSGNSWIVEGDLIDKLKFNATAGNKKAEMGETLSFKKEIKISVILSDPNTLNHNDQNPELDHVDLIMGKITGWINPSDPDYNNPVAPETKVIARFDNTGGITDENGITSIKWKEAKTGMISITYTIKTDEPCYFRLRGTNLGLNVTNETDANGNPLLDFEAGQNTAELAWNDLWFYSNPIFTIPQTDHSRHKSTFDETETSISSDNEEQLPEINLYPNPASNVLHINNVMENSKVEIYDISGILKASQNLTGNTIDVSGLEKGLYFIKVINGNEVNKLSFIIE